MTSPEPAATFVTGSRRPRWFKIVATLVLVGMLGAAAFGMWYLFLRPVPAAVSLGALPTASPTAAASNEPSPTVTESTATEPAPSGSTADPSEAPGATASSAPDGSGASSLDGTWAVDASIGSFADFTSSFVGYRVKEVLGSIGATTAVGRTPSVTGTLTLDGSTITAVVIEADLSTLESDSSMRDGQLRRQALETSTYPTATFTLTSPIELDSAPVDGETITATASGDLTLHGQTQAVQIAIEARLSGSTVTVVGSLPIVFADYGIAQPSSQSVLSIEDNGVMEFQLHFTRA